MSINFSTLQGLTIPEGVVTQIAKDGVVLWTLQNDKPIILEVEKITSNTYAGETTYENEEFILLDIYPKTNGTVNITYGGLTKTITDTSGAESPNAQQVFFGTFNGVSDSVTTPSSGTLTIDGDCVAFGCGQYEESSKTIFPTYCSCVTAITDFGNTEKIVDEAFCNCQKIENITIPSTVKSIGLEGALLMKGAFQSCSNLKQLIISYGVRTLGSQCFLECISLTEVCLPESVTTIRQYAFGNCTSLTSVTIPASVYDIGVNPFYACGSLDNIIVYGNNFISENGALFTFDKTKLISYPSAKGHYNIPNGVNDITYAFYYCENLTSVTIPSSITSIGIASFNRSGLTSVTIPENVNTIMQNAFLGCSALTNISFENTSNWYVSESTDLSNPISVDVSDPTNNATLLTQSSSNGGYGAHIWFRQT